MNDLKSENVTVFVTDLGILEYGLALQSQERYFNENVQCKLLRNQGVDTDLPKNYLLICEHPHVFTLGKSGSHAHLLLADKELKEKAIAFYHNNRGGDITYHGPGQVVGYPIIDLEQFTPDIKKYMYSLEEVIIQTLLEYGIVGDRVEGSTGVWLDVNTRKERKICAFGVKTSRWITMHGWGLNVNTDLSYFNYIVPCGIANKGVTSMEKELGFPVNLSEIKEKLIRNFGAVFNADMELI
jgi:lipoyl(octanoyl) transferase